MRWLLAVWLLAGCNPHLFQRSVSPPGRTARLDPVSGFFGTKHYRLELSEGIAVAVTCERSRPCRNVRVVSKDPSIAEVRTASLSALEERTPYGPDPAPTAAFVVIGKAPGQTKLRLRSKEGERDVYVSVVPSGGR